MPLFAIPFPAIDPVRSRSAPSPSAGTRWPISPGCCSAGAIASRWRDRPPRLVRDAATSTISWSGRRSASCSAAASATCCSTSRAITSSIPLEVARASGTAACRSTAACSASSPAMLLFARARGIPLFAFADIVAGAVPIGLFFGRIANFINGELLGRPTDVPWAMVFPNGGPLPRHPSQLYEAGLRARAVPRAVLARRSARRAARSRASSPACSSSAMASRASSASCSASPTSSSASSSSARPWASCCRCRMLLAGIVLIGARARRPRASAVTGALAAALLGRIRARPGPMTVADFMAEALHHPEHGYYAAPRSARRAPATSSPRRRSARCSAS